MHWKKVFYTAFLCLHTFRYIVKCIRFLSLRPSMKMEMFQKIQLSDWLLVGPSTLVEISKYVSRQKIKQIEGWVKLSILV